MATLTIELSSITDDQPITALNFKVGTTSGGSEILSSIAWGGGTGHTWDEAGAKATLVIDTTTVSEGDTVYVTVTDGDGTPLATTNSGVVTVPASTENWDVSTAIYDNYEFDISGQLPVDSSSGLTVNHNKTKLILADIDILHQYSIDATGNLSYDSVSLDLSALSGAFLRGIAFSSDGRYLVVANYDTNVYVFDIASGDEGTINNLTATPSHTLVSPSDTVRTIALNSDDSKIYFGSYNSTIRRFSVDLAAGTISDDSDLYVLPGASTINSITFGDNGHKLYASYQTDNQIRQYTTVTDYVMDGSTDDSNPLELSTWDSKIGGCWLDGNVMYVSGGSTQKIRRYTL